MMRCDAFIDLLDDVLNGCLPSQELDECDNHAANCANCSAYMNSYLVTIKAVRKLRKCDPPSSPQLASFNDQILARLASICG